MNLEHLNNLESYPSFTKQAGRLDGAINFGRRAANWLLGRGAPKAAPAAPAATAAGQAAAAASGQVAGQGAAAARKVADKIKTLEKELAASNKARKIAEKDLGRVQKELGKANERATAAQSEATANKNWARAGKIGTGVVALGGAGVGGAYINEKLTPPDHAQGGQGGLNQSNVNGNSNGNSNGDNSNGLEAELDWIDEAAAKISEFYEKHPGIAWGGTGLAALGGLYGLYNALDDEDEDEDY